MSTCVNLFIVLVTRERGGKDNLGGEIVGAKARRQPEPGHMQEAGRGWPGWGTGLWRRSGGKVGQEGALESTRH